MKRHLSRIARIAFTLVVLAMLIVFARKVDWSGTWGAIRQASISVLVIAALVNLASLALKGVRWWIFLRPVGAESLWLAMRATFAGAGLNNVLVANSGEAARVIFVSRAAHIPSARTLATLALERLFELIGYVVLLALAATFLALPQNIERVRPFAIGALVLVVVFLVWLVKRPDSEETIVETAVATHWMIRTKAYFRKFLHTLSGISTGPRFIAALLLSVAIWALQVATYQLTARAAHFPITLVGTIAALIAVNLGFAIRATPGNVGVFQALYAAVAVGFGLSGSEAVAVAFLIQAQQILPVTALGVGLAPEFIFKRRRSERPDNLLPGEPIPKPQT